MLKKQVWKQKMQIEFISYPVQEYGFLTAKVKLISSAPDDNGYMIDISIPNKLITNYGKKIPFSPKLIGNGKIFTHDKFLIERFFEKIIFIFE